MSIESLLWLRQRYHQLRVAMGGRKADQPEGDLPPPPAPSPTPATLFVETGYTPEEYLLEVIRSRDGRVRQQKLQEFTGWSASTVSRHLSKMEANGSITRIRSGAEKIIVWPPEATA